MKIGFRVDAGNLIGTGHLQEVLTIVQALNRKAGVTPVFISTDNQFTREKLSALPDCRLRIIPGNLNDEEEAASVIEMLKADGCAALVVDLRSVSEKYLRMLHEAMVKTVVIMDTAEFVELPASVVVNFAITQNPGLYGKAHRFPARYLIGPSYFPIGGNFLSKAVAVEEEVRTIFLNQGGSDPFGLTAKIIRSLEKDPLPQKVVVVVGGALMDSHMEELERLKDGLRGNYEFHHNLPPEGMASVLEKSDVAVTAAGNTLYEITCLGIPAAVISHHEKHDIVAEAFAKKGAILNLGIGTGLGEESILAGINKLCDDFELRKTLAGNSRKVVDGFGAGRIADAILTLSGALT